MPVQRRHLLKGLYNVATIGFSCWWIMVTVSSISVVVGEDLATKLASQPSPPKCHNFSKGWKQTEEGGEFFSPNYPNNYYNNTECTLTLIAPPNNRIEIDFRERFQIESSTDCEHDFLEVFDGLGGHRHRLARLCGMEFPKEKIFSSGRFLYVRFKSDDTAEYGGFKAVFFFKQRAEKVPPVSESCEWTESGFEGIIGTDNYSEEFREYSLQGNEINCLWVINVTEGYTISLYFWSFQLLVPNDCEKNFLRVYMKQLDDAHLQDRYCGTQAKNHSYKEVPIYLYMFETPLAGSHSNFKVHYTIYRTISTAEECTKDEFDCQDSSCVDRSLRCNGRQNCKYQTDEENCNVAAEEMFLFQEKVMVILIIGVLLLLSLGVAMVVSCRRQWKDLQKRKKELASRYSVPGGLDRLAPCKSDINIASNDIDDGCYVPEVDLSVFHKSFNGGNAIAFDQDTVLSRMDTFHRSGDSRSSSNSTLPPPLPVMYQKNMTPANIESLHRSQTYAKNPSTIDDELDEVADIFPLPISNRQSEFGNRRLNRADAIIQLEPDRLRSYDSSSSTPDVVGRH